jgi:very-short-patch-repair endonuclease
MRREPTEAERRLWRSLRASQLGGYKFRRQAPICNRIVDFFCPGKGLIVELDGDTHDPIRDANRDEAVRATFGLTTLRFSNRDMMENPDGLLHKLLETLEALPDRWPEDTTPGPSSEEEGSAE